MIDAGGVGVGPPSFGRMKALERSLAAIESERRAAEARFIEALDHHAEATVIVMGRVHDALGRPDGLRAAAKLLTAWSVAGGAHTSEPGAAELKSLAEAAAAFVEATARTDRLREANRLRLSNESIAPTRSSATNPRSSWSSTLSFSSLRRCSARFFAPPR